jgi:hypothetical protein
MSTDPADHTSIVPASFAVPEILETTEFRLRMLTVRDLIADDEAVTSSAAHLQAVFRGGGWSDGLTLEQNLIDLGWHQKEFQRRSSFAYTVVDPSERRVLGCVYIDPTRQPGCDAEVTMWARQSKLATGLETRLVAAVRDRLARAWPFDRVDYPGRDLDRADHQFLPGQKR